MPLAVTPAHFHPTLSGDSQVKQPLKLAHASLSSLARSLYLASPEALKPRVKLKIASGARLTDCYQSYWILGAVTPLRAYK